MIITNVYTLSSQFVHRLTMLRNTTCVQIIAVLLKSKYTVIVKIVKNIHTLHT